MLLVAPLLALQAGAATPAPPVDPFDDCEQYSMADKHDCIAKLARSSALALDKAEAKAAAAIARWDGDAKDVKQARARLQASNAMFSAYRLHQCAFSVATVGGGAGNSRDTARLTCLAQKNLQRTQELARETDGLPRK
nr:lysozyme inhibitor LprI family protein [Massilia genomosp. 1]